MKKRRIMATITALAVAAAGFFVPASENNGLNVKTSALVTGGGLWLSKIKDPTATAAGDIVLDSGGNDPWNSPTTITTLDEDINVWPYSLAKGDLVQLNIRVPNLSTDLDDVGLEIAYNKDNFICVQWYQTGYETAGRDFTPNELDMMKGTSNTYNGQTVYGYADLDSSNNIKDVHGYTQSECDRLGYTTQAQRMWPAAGDYVGNTKGDPGAQTGEAYFRKDGAELDLDPSISASSYYGISLASPTETKNEIKAFNGKDIDLHARFRVKKDITLDDIVESSFIITTAKFSKDGVDVWEPAVKTVKAMICMSISGKLVKYDPFQMAKVQAKDSSNNNLYEAVDGSGQIVDVTQITEGENRGKYQDSSNNIYNTAIPKMINSSSALYSDTTNNVFDPSKTFIGIKGDPNSIKWWTISSEKKARWVNVEKDGSFVIRGVIPNGGDYYLKTNLWCLNNEYKVNTSNDNTINWRIWLYGDVDYNGEVGANDSTQILRYLVGKYNMINSDYATGDYSGENYCEAIDQNRKASALTIANLYNSDAMKLYYGTGAAPYTDSKVSVKSATQILVETCYSNNEKKSIIDYVQKEFTVDFFVKWLEFATVPTEAIAAIS